MELNLELSHQNEFGIETGFWNCYDERLRIGISLGIGSVMLDGLIRNERGLGIVTPIYNQKRNCVRN